MADPMDEALEGAPATPAGRQAAWYLRRVQAAGAAGERADRARVGPTLPNFFRQAETDAQVRDEWRAAAERLGAPLASASFAAVSDLAVEVTIAASKDRRWKLTLAVEAA